MKQFRLIITMAFVLTSLVNLAQKKPNILLILSDDHSVPFVGCYGYNDLNTPNLDKLAAEGIRFDNAYTCAPQCVPSRASIQSGRNVIDIEMSRFQPLPRDVKVIPEYLREVGYYTGICGRSYHLDSSSRKAKETVEAFEKHNLVTFHERVDYLNIGADDEVLGQFNEFLDGNEGDKPFFMWMNYSDPHRPFTAYEFAPNPEKIAVPDIFPDTKEVRKDLSQHLGEINRLDFHIGQILQTLEKRELRENTLIIFIGDNGAALLRGKGTLYDLGIHVPLIVNAKSIKAKGTVSDVMISGIDMAPTILEIAGVKKPEVMTGESFNPVLEGKHLPGTNTFLQRVLHGTSLPKHTSAFDLIRTVFNKEYKLIYNVLWQLPYTPVDFNNRQIWQDLVQKNEAGELDEKFLTALFAEPRPMFQLYDLKNDPGELNNLSGNPEFAKIEHQFKAVLHEWMTVNWDHLPLPIAPPPKNKQ